MPRNRRAKLYALLAVLTGLVAGTQSVEYDGWLPPHHYALILGFSLVSGLIVAAFAAFHPLIPFIALTSDVRPYNRAYVHVMGSSLALHVLLFSSFAASITMLLDTGGLGELLVFMSIGGGLYAGVCAGVFLLRSRLEPLPENR